MSKDVERKVNISKFNEGSATNVRKAFYPYRQSQYSQYSKNGKKSCQKSSKVDIKS